MPKTHLNFRRLSLLILVTFFSSLAAFKNPEDPLKKLIAFFNLYLTELPQEKVYLHTDRTFYASGETIWFKAYITTGPNHEPSLLSKTVYVELLEENGEVLHYLNLFSPDGFASGHIDLPDSLSSGDYLLRAYTNWMRNFDEAYFFHQQIKILNPESSTQALTPSHSDLDIQFFPEGGSLVEGILSKVAVKAIGQDGLGRKIQGEILEDGIKIGDFKSNHLGMGIFGLLPQAGKVYQAKILNTDLMLGLPSAMPEGIVLSVTNSPTSPDVLVKIQTSTPSQIPSIHLVAQTRGLICATSTVDLSNRIAFVRIPKKEFPTGIAQLTALDSSGTPLAERLIFINHQDHLQISISSDKPSYAPRDPVVLTIETKNKDGVPLPANLSLSALDEGQIPHDPNQPTIHSYLLMSSELKGYLESPGYYFNPENKDREEALDLLMVTQGWRRFTFREALNHELPKPIYSPEKGISLKGRLLDKNNNPLEGGSVSYLSIYPIAESRTVLSETGGQFEFRDLLLFDSTEFTIKGKPKNGNASVNIHLENTYESPRSGFGARLLAGGNIEIEERFISKAAERKRIDQAFDFTNSELELSEVEVKGKRITETEEYRGPRIYGGGTAMIKVAGKPELENLFHPLELVQGRVAGVQVSGSGINWDIKIQGVNSINSSLEPLILLNDIPIDAKQLHTLPVQEIESFVVWKGPDTAIFGARGANGVIGFYTKKSNETPQSNSANNQGFLRRKGYQIEREFYAPKYDTDEVLHSKPDQRATIFWAPMIQTDAAGKATVRFFNADLNSTIRIEIEGLSLNGIPGHSDLHYQVEKK